MEATFREFTLTMPELFSQPWEQRQAVLVNAVEYLGRELREGRPSRQVSFVTRGIGTTTILSAAMLWLAKAKIARHVLYVTRDSATAQLIADNVWDWATWSEPRPERCRLDLYGAVLSFRGVFSGFQGMHAKCSDGVERRPEVVLVDDLGIEIRSSEKHGKIANVLSSIIPGLGGPGCVVSILRAFTIGLR